MGLQIPIQGEQEPPKVRNLNQRNQELFGIGNPVKGNQEHFGIENPYPRRAGASQCQKTPSKEIRKFLGLVIPLQGKGELLKVKSNTGKSGTFLGLGIPVQGNQELFGVGNSSPGEVGASQGQKPYPGKSGTFWDWESQTRQSGSSEPFQGKGGIPGKQQRSAPFLLGELICANSHSLNSWISRIRGHCTTNRAELMEFLAPSTSQFSQPLWNHFPKEIPP